MTPLIEFYVADAMSEKFRGKLLKVVQFSCGKVHVRAGVDVSVWFIV